MSEYSWAKDLLTRMGYEVNQNNVTAIVAWEYAEGGHFHNGARFNPLNTTMAHGRYGSMNSAGVATYPSYEVGMRETVATLRLDSYAKVRHSLATSAAPATTAAAVAASPWGTWHGVASGPALTRARATVGTHDGLAKGGKHDGKHDGKHGGQGHGPAHGKGAGTKIVLDLHELDRLSRTYCGASDEILRHRRVVADIAAAIEPARVALPDQGLATVIKATFDWLLEPGGGFEDDARQHDALSQLTGEIHRLATEADGNHNGSWGRGEAMAFAAKHQGEQGAALDAVMAALAGGTIVRRSPKGAGSADAARGTNGGTSRGGASKGGASKGGGSGDGGSGRQQQVDSMLAVARAQHAVEHNHDNRTKYGAWYGNNGDAWCAQFVSYVFAHSGNRLPAIDSPKGFQSCPRAITYLQARHQLHSTPKVGDVFLRRDGQHTGIVSKVHADGTFDTIEGNAGPQTDRVYHGTRNTHDGLYWFWTAIR
ncbi:CHAP domain-containing protein [Jatrophihabitans endophyticus]|nr:CHAP domain-containing protein [Jatrophihabitans endophyticus]